MAKRDPYEVLEINKNATKDEVKKAYRRLAKMYHPDQYIDNPLADLAKDKFLEVQEAYDTIMDGQSNSNYGYSSNTYSSSQSSYSNRSFTMEEIKALIAQGRNIEAKMAIGNVQEKTPEWYYLSGVLDLNLGSYNSGLNYLKMATQLDPTNEEYRKTYEDVNSQMGGYKRSNMSYNRSGGLPLGCCCQLIICDCCSECLGCDCIPCI